MDISSETLSQMPTPIGEAKKGSGEKDEKEQAGSDGSLHWRLPLG
jgi:hypothetical protein